MTDPQFIAWLKTADSIRTLLVEVIANISGVETTLYLSSRAYVTASTDTPANTAYLSCISGGGVTTEQLSMNGQPNISFADLEIDNTGGVRDGWLKYVWANRRVKIYMGDPRWIRSDFRQIFDGVVDDIDSRSEEVLNLRFLDKLQRLNNPISETLLNGTTQNKDRLIPSTFGECFNVTPLLKDPATLTYQYHDSAAEGVIEVRSNGAVPVTKTDTPASGYFALGVAPAGTEITVSVQGDKVGGVYSNDITSNVKRIATGYGPTNTRFSAGDLDTTNLNAFAAAHTQAIGLYCPDRVNQLDGMQQLAASVGAQVVTTTLGLLRIVQVTLPPPGTPTVVTTDDMDYHSLKIEERIPVRAAIKLGYCKNWTVQSGIAAGVPISSSGLFTGTRQADGSVNEYMVTTASDATTATTYLQDKAPEQENTLLIASADATAEASRRLALWKTPRTVYSFTGRPSLLLAELGDAITITHPRFSLTGGVTGMVVRISRDWLNGRITLGVLA